MPKVITILLFSLIISSCTGQDSGSQHIQQVGGPCEDCEATLDYETLGLTLSPIDTLAEFLETEPKINITGTLLRPDGKTPAENVVIYVYHTNREGIYEPSQHPFQWERRHGKFRGWMKTGPDGKFSFYTFRPAPYPDGHEAEHIHIYLAEPGKSPYYIDNYVFGDDPLLTPKEIPSLANRGGSGIIQLKMENGILTANRDIILGLNIPHYKSNRD